MSINIAYACNEAYMEQTVVSIISLLKNCSVSNQLRVYFIDMGVMDSSKEEMRRLIKEYGSQFIVIPFDEIAFDLNISENMGRHIKSVYAKLFFGRISEIDRIIYLDSDTVITGDIKDLWEIDLGNDVCGGVETIHSKEDNVRIGYPVFGHPINDGVVLINLKKWREENFLEKCLEFIADNNGEPPVLSEGTLNVVCKDCIKIIHPRYNLLSAMLGTNIKKIEILTGRKYYSQGEIDEAIREPCIIHYLSGFYNRPWCKECSHPMKNEYLKYRKMTKWANKPLNTKKLNVRLKIIGFMYNYLPTGLFIWIRRIIKYK